MNRVVLAILVLVLGMALLHAAPAHKKPVNARDEEAARGDAWALAGRCDDAVPHYEKALGAGGASEAKLRARLAQCMVAQHPDKAAQADLVVQAGLTMAREPELLLVAGDMALRRGDAAKAVALFGEAEKGATRLEARLARLGALVVLGQHDEEYKRTALELAKTIVADPAEPQEGRAHADELLEQLRYGAQGKTMLEVRHKLADGDAKAALALLQPVLATTPPIEEASYAQGLCLQALDQRKEAMAAFAKAPHVKEAQALYGIGLYESDELAGAARAFDAALAIDARYQPALYYAGLVAKERGDASTARSLLGRAVSADHDSALGRQASSKLELLTGQLRSLAEGQVVDAAQEVAIGQQIADQVSLHFGASQDTATQERLDAILHRLAKVADRPERELRYHVQIIEAPVINALTLPGGTVLVFRGIIDMVKKEMGDTDDAWAAILGHECAHAALRHGVGMLSMVGTLTGPNAFEAGTVDLASLMNTISREHEFEADQFGALYAYRAGYHPAASLRLHEAMLRATGEIPRGLTHPTHEERMFGLRDYLMELRGKVHGFDLAVQSLKDNDPDAAIVRLEVFLGVFPDSLSARSNLGVALQRKAAAGLTPSADLRRMTDIDPESGARKIELHATGDVEKPKLDRHLLQSAVSEYRSALAVDPSYAPALTNLGAALFDLGDKKGARVALDRAIARAPRAPEAWINHASVAEAEGKLDEAQSDLRRAIAIDAKAQIAWFDLALVSEKLKRVEEAKQAWDRYLALDGKGAWADAARQRRAALK